MNLILRSGVHWTRVDREVGVKHSDGGIGRSWDTGVTGGMEVPFPVGVSWRPEVSKGETDGTEEVK